MAVADSEGLVRPTAEEIALSWMLPDGIERPVPVSNRLAGPPSPRQALEAAIWPALLRAPCVIDFSGGRDSSLVLAVAVHLARREGLPLPVARTRRFGGDDASAEPEWQRSVIDHLGVDDWEIVEYGERLDVVGDLAQAFLRRYGIAFPAPLFVVADSIAAAAGGSHMSGEGGDEVLGLRRSGWARLVVESPRSAAHRLRNKRQRRTLVKELAPRPLRQRLYERDQLRSMPGLEWLRPEVGARLARQMGRSFGSEPLDYGEGLAWELAQRVPVVYQHNQRIVAAGHDVLHVDPLLDRGFVEALVRAGGRLGFASRAATMDYVAGDLLPEKLLHRPDKAVFNTAYFTSVARRFVERWDGTGLDTSLVYPDVLRREWSKEVPAANSYMLLQAAWLATEGQAP